MRTIGVVALVLCFGVAFAVVGGSGIGAEIFGVSDSEDAETARTLDKVAKEADTKSDDDEEGGISGDVGGDNEPTVTGFVFSGATFIVRLVGAVALLPITLINLGWPAFFAVPIGGAAQIVATVGLLQFITGREYL